MGVLIREVTTLYAALSETNQSPTLTELPVQYCRLRSMAA
jgi:hypothetical protein